MDMRVSVEQSHGLERRIRVRVPASGVESSIDQRLREIARGLKLKGFRPGKVPDRVVRQHYGTEIRRQVVQEFLQRACREAIRQQNLEAVGPARIEQQPGPEGDELDFVATFEVYPDFEIVGLDRLRVERPVVTVTEADVDELIAGLRRQRRRWQAVGRPARAGDRLAIEILPGVDAAAGAPATGQAIALVLGEAQLRPDIAARLTGVAAGAVFDVDLAHAGDAAPAPRRLRVLEVAGGQLPDVDAEFCRGFGIASGAPADLRAAAVADMERDATRHAAEDVRLQLLGQLADATTAELPVMLCEQESARLQRQALERSPAGLIAGLPAQDQVRAIAARNVRMGLIARKIFREQRMRIMREEVNARIVAGCQPGEDVEQKQNWYFQHPELVEEIEHSLIDDKVVDWLQQRATIVDRPMSFVELLDLRRQHGGRPGEPGPDAPQ